MSQPMSFYDLKAEMPKGEQLSMSDFKGKVVMVVNVASKCGFTPQYAGLEELYQKYKDQGFTIIGFPCNQFGYQEPGSDEQIAQFCSMNYNVSFPITKKIQVNGGSTDPIWANVKSQKSGLLGMSLIKWNFEKFLVGKDGKVVQRYASTTKPADIAPDVEKALAA